MSQAFRKRLLIGEFLTYDLDTLVGHTPLKSINYNPTHTSILLMDASVLYISNYVLRPLKGFWGFPMTSVYPTIRNITGIVGTIPYRTMRIVMNDPIQFLKEMTDGE